MITKEFYRFALYFEAKIYILMNGKKENLMTCQTKETALPFMSATLRHSSFFHIATFYFYVCGLTLRNSNTNTFDVNSYLKIMAYFYINCLISYFMLISVRLIKDLTRGLL